MFRPVYGLINTDSQAALWNLWEFSIFSCILDTFICHYTPLNWHNKHISLDFNLSSPLGTPTQ